MRQTQVLLWEDRLYDLSGEPEVLQTHLRLNNLPLGATANTCSPMVISYWLTGNQPSKNQETTQCLTREPS